MSETTIAWNRLLHQVNKPSRYINHELNARRKDFVSAGLRFCLGFPDVYEIGISHFGLKILYSIINEHPQAMADRVYLPWLDAVSLMKKDNIALIALESKRKVQEFDILGITLQSELNYTNVLELLSLSGIPLHSEDRGAEHPLVLAGGPCASNPLPLAPFIDAFLIGEGEEVVGELIEILLNTSRRSERLQQIAKLEGMYVRVIHDKLRSINPDFSVRIRKFDRFHLSTHLHSPQLLPWQLSIHNRFISEIMRGCTRGCRFCHAGYFYRPVRERSPEDIAAQILMEAETYGWEEAGLLSLASTDYSCIRSLLLVLAELLDTEKTHISLPSLRADTIDDKLAGALHRMGREGLTLAPEAGSQRLRNVINKNLTEEDILSGVKTAKELGWQKIKLYFMVGLPYETDEDITAIIDLIRRVVSFTGKSFQINVSVSPFIPKPHTPFQWAGMPPAEEILRRILLIKHAFSHQKFIKVRYHTVENTLLEAVLSRGDESTALWLENAWSKGALFDGWVESFDWNIWTAAARDIGYDWQTVTSSLKQDTILPWDFIKLGIDQQFLLDEWQKATKAQTTPDCRETCLACGLCDFETTMKLQNTRTEDEIISNLKAKHPQIFSYTLPSEQERRLLPNQSCHYYRLYYQKSGDFRFVGHLDWMRMVYRLIARSKLQIIYTQGFSPHPAVSFCPPLPTGVSGLGEYFNFRTLLRYSEEEVAESFAPFLRDELKIKHVQILSKAEYGWQPKAEIISCSFPAVWKEEISLKAAEFEQLDEYKVTTVRKEKTRHYDLKQLVWNMELQGSILTFCKKLESPGIYNVLSYLLRRPAEDLYSVGVTRIALID